MPAGGPSLGGGPPGLPPGAGPPMLSQMGGPAGGGGVSRSIFEVKKQVRSLATAIPAAAREIAQIDQLLDAVMMKALPGGGGPAGSGGLMAEPQDPAVDF
jgi:hypothetical protein